MRKKTIGFMFFFLFSEYHAFGVDDLSVDDEGVEVHAGQERRGTDLDAAVAESVDGIGLQQQAGEVEYVGGCGGGGGDEVGNLGGGSEGVGGVL